MTFQFEDFLSGIDSVMILDENYIILHAMRINNRISNADKKRTHNHDRYINHSIFDIFPSIPIEKSSYSEARAAKKPVIKYNQNYSDCYGMVCRTNNITIPLLRQGKVCGYVGLSKDITTVDAIMNSDSKPAYIPQYHIRSGEKVTFDDIITRNDTMIKAITLSKRLAFQNSPILVYGETGTGKELFVQAMINYSNIPRSKVITQNCAAIPDNLIESMLFGTTKGSFTGAETKEGLMQMADGGILFLDELNSLPYHVQGSLLRVLQEGTYRPVGSQHEKKSTTRIIAAMNINPLEAITKKQLREDLFYRFSNGVISLVPLRNRIEDIELYLDYYLDLYRRKTGRIISGYSNSLIKLLKTYPWPGNVRELSHLVEFMISNADGQTLTIVDLPAYMMETVENTYTEDDPGAQNRPSPAIGVIDGTLNELGYDKYMENFEKELIAKALYEHRGSITNTAEYLKLPRQTLTYKMRKHSLERKAFAHPEINN